MKKFVLETSKHMKTPMGMNEKLSKDEIGVLVDPTIYRSMIRSLLHLTLLVDLTLLLVLVNVQSIKQIPRNHTLI